ncbi:hypothetical protein GCM10027346_42070 [Hymenobacter seoulensis]
MVLSFTVMVGAEPELAPKLIPVWGCSSLLRSPVVIQELTDWAANTPGVNARLVMSSRSQDLVLFFIRVVGLVVEISPVKGRKSSVENRCG